MAHIWPLKSRIAPSFLSLLPASTHFIIFHLNSKRKHSGQVNQYLDPFPFSVVSTSRFHLKNCLIWQQKVFYSEMRHEAFLDLMKLQIDVSKKEWSEGEKLWLMLSLVFWPYSDESSSHIFSLSNNPFDILFIHHLVSFMMFEGEIIRDECERNQPRKRRSKRSKESKINKDVTTQLGLYIIAFLA